MNLLKFFGERLTLKYRKKKVPMKLGLLQYPIHSEKLRIIRYKYL